LTVKGTCSAWARNGGKKNPGKNQKKKNENGVQVTPHWRKKGEAVKRRGKEGE